MASLTIKGRTAELLESEPFIEPYRCYVLLVYVSHEIRAAPDRVFDKQPADAVSVKVWIDEQSFHPIAVQQHKAYHRTGIIYGEI